jgi:hypothetical protein
MICLRANLVAGDAHDRIAAGTSVAALMFVRADNLEAAEELAAQQLSGRGWARMETERSKEITDFSQFESKGGVVGQAFQDAKESGFGVVIYPEPGT